MAGFLSMGGGTHKVPLELFRLNRRRLVEELRKLGSAAAGAVVLLRGGVDEGGLNETDANDYSFQQESYFHWAFGTQEPDCMGTIDVDSGKATLFVPKLPSEYAVWMGKINGPDFFKTKYEVDECLYTNELASTLKAASPSKLLLLHGENSDTSLFTTPASFEGMEEFETDKALLHPAMAELRVFKTPMEQELLRYACAISVEAHKAMMKAVAPEKFEYQMESVFRHSAYHDGGARHVGYCCIGASGPNAAVLHYGHAAAPNARQLKDGDLCLFDMGASYMRYTADITSSFPVNGKFSPDQIFIYEAVLDASMAVMKAARPGVSWPDMHLLAERHILKGLVKAGILRGDVEEMMKLRLGATFQPHGLGHFLGIDVHDVHGYPPDGPPRSKEPGLRSLRTSRVLQKDMFITIEPGCYFIDHLLDAALADTAKAAFICPERLAQFRGFGGVRIEDDVLITQDGVENFSILPRTVQEIEEFMARKQ